MSANYTARLADLAIRLGVNLQCGQALVIRAPLAASDLVLELTGAAYRLGAGPVTCLFEDPRALRARLLLANERVLGEAPAWLPAAVATAHEQGAARLDVLGPLPELVEDVPLSRVLRGHKAFKAASHAETRVLERRLVNASTLLLATGSWARRVFTGDSVEAAVTTLDEVLRAATYADGPDAAARLGQHLAELDARAMALQALDLRSLRLHGDETDLTVDLAAGYRWVGATDVAGNGIRYAPSLIAEDVRVAADCRSARGRLALTQPISVAGDVIAGAMLEFRDGDIVSMTAASGRAALEGVLSVDAGAGRITAIGLAPKGTPATRYATGFHNPTVDRTSGCHVRFGRPDVVVMSSAVGDDVGRSSIGIDAIVGAVDVDARCAWGQTVPLMRSGTFMV